MELVRDLFVPAVDAAGNVVDRLLPAEVARSDGRRPPPSFRSKLSAYLAMVPAADFLSDCALFSVLLQGAVVSMYVVSLRGWTVCQRSVLYALTPYARDGGLCGRRAACVRPRKVQPYYACM